MASGHVDRAVDATLGLGWVGGSHLHAKERSHVHIYV